MGVNHYDPDTYTVFVGPPKLTLDRSWYYASPNASYVHMRNEMVSLMESSFKAVGWTGDPAKVLAFETKLNNKTAFKFTPGEKINFRRIFSFHQMRKMSFKSFADSYPVLAPYFGAIGAVHEKFAGDSPLFVSKPGYFGNLKQFLDPASNDYAQFETIKDFVAWRLILELAPSLGDEPGASLESFQYWMQWGVRVARRPLASRCIAATRHALHGYIDQIWVERAFPPAAQAQVEIMIGTIKKAMKEVLLEVTWMDAPTREQALWKLEEMNFKVGAPSKWPSHHFPVGGEFLANQMASFQESTRTALAMYGQKRDKTMWSMAVSEANAYYSPGKNEMVFPAGILQPPFFSPHAPMVLNYASIGSIMGHELTHGYDDNGAEFDGHGVEGLVVAGCIQDFSATL